MNDFNDAAPKPRSRKRKWKVLACVLLTPLVLLAGVYFYMAHRAQQELRAAIAEADELDPGWRLEELESKRIVLPKERNAAELVLSAAAALPQGNEMLTVSELLGDQRPDIQLNDRQVAALQDFSQKAKDALNLAASLSEDSRGRYDVAWAPDYITTLVLHLDRIRSVAGSLQFATILAAHVRDYDRAMRYCAAIIRVGRSIGDEPLMISQFVRVNCQKSAQESLERILGQGEVQETALAKMQQDIEEDADFLILFAVRGERAMADGIYRNLPSALRAAPIAGVFRLNTIDQAGMHFPAVVQQQRAACLRYMTELVEIAKRPFEEQGMRLDELERSLTDKPSLMRQLVSSPKRYAKYFQRHEALRRCAIVMLAAERYRIASQRWPGSLAELLSARLLSEPLTDPFDGKPLRLRKSPNGLIIYSIGQDLIDNGGKLNRQKPMETGTDLGFQLWDVARRRQPPLPEKPQETGAPAP